MNFKQFTKEQLVKIVEAQDNRLKELTAIIDAQQDYIDYHDNTWKETTTDQEREFIKKLNSAADDLIHEITDNIKDVVLSVEEINKMNEEALFENFVRIMKQGGVDLSKGGM